VSRRRRIARWALAALALLVALALVNALLVSRETQPARADAGRVLELPGPDLQVREDGPRGAPALVLLHGTPGSLRWWDRAVPALARDHRVVRFDLLGHGGSEKPRDGYGIPGQARQLGVALDRLGVDRALVVGYSYGGVLATALVEQRPEKVRGLVVLASNTRTRFVDAPLVARIAEWPIVGQLVNRLSSRGAIEDALEVSLAREPVPGAFVDDVRDMTHSSFVRSRQDARSYLDERPSHERLAGARVPLLAISGSRDEVVDPAVLRDWARVPGARTVLIRGAGHTVQWDDPDRTVREIRAFERSLGR
jgi:pimeloyl-ACP methyl ester carboxylesterase